MESLGLEANTDQEPQLEMIPDNLGNSSEILKQDDSSPMEDSGIKDTFNYYQPPSDLG